MKRPSTEFIVGAGAVVLLMVYYYGFPSNATNVLGLAIGAWVGGWLMDRAVSILGPAPEGDPEEEEADPSSTPFILFRHTVYCQYMCMEHKTRCMKNAMHMMWPGSTHAHPVWGFEEGWVQLSLHHYGMEEGLAQTRKLKVKTGSDEEGV